MMYNIKRFANLFPLISLIVLACFPDTVLASVFPWSAPQSDKSIAYLGQIFGTVGNALSGAPNALIGNMFQIFNIAVLSIGSLVVSYTIILSTVNTAQEGEVMGRKWSSLWIPLRCAVGMAFLLPAPGGYSIIQIIMMQFVVWGVAAADQVWAQVYLSIKSGTGALGTINVSNSQLNSAAEALLDSLVCAETMNNDPVCQAAISGQRVAPYTKNGQLLVGVAGDSNYSNVCGGLKAGNTPSNVSDSSAWQASNLAAFNSAVGSLQPAAAEIYASSDSSTWTASNPISTAANNMAGTLTSTQTASSTGTASASSIDNGWLFTGSYYFELVTTSGSGSNMSYPAPTAVSADKSNVGDQCTTKIANYSARSSDYIDNTQQGSSQQTSLNLGSGPSNEQAMQLYSGVSGAVVSLTEDLLNTLSTNADDPISSFRNVGSQIMTTTENLWFTIMIIGVLIMLVGCILSGINPLCFALGVIITVAVPILTLIISLLWGAGAAIGLYLPLVPYLVFTFTAMGWFILVIETLAAAPIVSLGLVSPAQEHLGKAAPAVLLITNVFLRPSLMVIGFVAAVKLTNAIVNMINFGFSATVNSAVSGLGIFGCIALICLYGGLIIAVVHECFTLVHVLPDKIMRWIGGNAEQSGQSIKTQLQEVKGATDKGAEIGGSIMKSTAGMMGEKAAAKSKKGGPETPDGLGM